MSSKASNSLNVNQVGCIYFNPTTLFSSLSGNSGYLLTSNGTGVPSSFQKYLAAFSIVNIQTFTSSGTYTPTTGMAYCIVEIVGDGGGGGGVIKLASGNNNACGGGGGGGAYAKGVFSAATIGASQTVTIGTGGGGGGNTGTTGTGGGGSSFGSLLICAGGAGGVGDASTTNTCFVLGGAGGTASGSGVAFSVAGEQGDCGYGIYGAIIGNYGSGGKGGATVLGFGAMSVDGDNINSNGNNGQNYGSGGGGGANTSTSAGVTAGNGAPGICIVTEFII